MKEEHPVFPKLENENSKIWRFMDFTKFVSLLDTKSLFFSRSDHLEDPFEGSMPKANLQQRSLWYGDMPENTLKQMSSFREKLRFHTFLNCWHINEVESDAMWKIYVKNNAGIVIQSTYKRLVDVLNKNEQIYVGGVKYVDYDIEVIPENNTFWPYVHKQKSFEHEHELRAVIQHIPSLKKGIDINIPGPLGINESVDLEKLIETIFIAPTSPDWFNNLVHSMLKKYSLSKKVFFSKLSERPVY